MSQLLQGCPQETTGQLKVNNGQAAPSYFNNGLPFDAAGSLAVDINTAIASYHQGLPFTAAGRLAVTPTAVSYYGSGAAPFALGKLSMNQLLPVWYLAGVPYNVDGLSVVMTSVTPPSNVSAGGPYQGYLSQAINITGSFTGSAQGARSEWSIVSGGTGTFGDPNALVTTFRPDNAGPYSLKLTVLPNFSTPIDSPPATLNVLTTPALPIFSLNLQNTIATQMAVASTPTYTRNSNASVRDYEGILWNNAAGEANFAGARRTNNTLVGNSDTPTLSGLFLADIASTPCFRVSFEGTGTLTLTGGVTATIVGSASGRTVSALYLPTSIIINYAITGTVTKLMGMYLPGADKNPYEYISVGAGLTFPFHGAGIDGIKYFPYKNGNRCTGGTSQGLQIDGVGPALTTGDYNCDVKGPVGLLLEKTATNVVLSNRNLTGASNWGDFANANYVVSLTTGMDNTANAASRLTASGGNAVIFQAITAASSAWCFSVDIKRITGTGPVAITLDGGTTWTTVTSQLIAGSWVRVFILQTLANPKIGIRVSTLGDVIDVDFLQCEVGNYPSSRISVPSTTAAVQRSPDVLNYPAANFSGVTGSVSANLKTNWTSNVATCVAIACTATNLTAGNTIYASPTSSTISSTDGTTFITTNAAGAPSMYDQSVDCNAGWGAGTFQNFFNHGASTSGNPTFDGLMGDGTILSIGNIASGAGWGGNMRNIKTYNFKLTPAEIATLP